MTATLAPTSSPQSAAATRASRTLAPTAAEAEMHRWLIRLGTPFVLGSVFFALSIATDREWPIGVALFVGPILFLLETVYLCISSDSNGETPDEATFAAQHDGAAPVRVAA